MFLLPEVTDTHTYIHMLIVYFIIHKAIFMSVYFMLLPAPADIYAGQSHLQIEKLYLNYTKC